MELAFFVTKEPLILCIPLNKVINRKYTNTALFLCSLSILLLPRFLSAQDIEKAPRIWSVTIEGNSTYEDIVIKEFISTQSPSLWKRITFYNEKDFYISERDIQRDVIRIQRFYQQRGYINVRVSYRLDSLSEPWKKELVFVVDENQPVRVNNVEFRVSASKKDSLFIMNNRTIQKQIASLEFRKGQRFTPIRKTEVEGTLSRNLKNLGYAYAYSEVLSKIDTAALKADVILITYPGPRTRIDSILVEGEATLAEKYIIRETGIKKGEIYNNNLMRNAQREVFNHHLFRFALISIPDQEQDSTLNVLVRVGELSTRSLQLTLGVGNFDRIEGRIYEPHNSYRIFRGQANWIYRNVRGKGERFTASIRASGFEQQLGANYLFPYVFNTKSNAIFAPFVKHKIEPSYEIISGGLNSSLIYIYNQRLTGTVSYELTQNNEVARKAQFNLPDSVLSYNVSSITLNAYYSKGLREGRRGLVIQPNVEFSGLFNESTFSFQKVSLGIRKYTELNDGLVLATRVLGGAIYYSRQDSLPNDIRFFTGGTNTVRGFSRQELGPKRPVFFEEGGFNRYVPRGGNALLNFNIEFRQALNRVANGFGIAGFLDGGQVWSSLSTISKVPIQYGAGGGLRYQSPIGPIRIDVAYKLNPNKEDLNIYNGIDYGGKLDRWGIHFSIGQAF